MFSLEFFTFEYFGSIILFATAIVPLFSEIQDWLPDFGEWTGKFFQGFLDSVKGFFDWINDEIKSFIATVIEAIKSFANGVYELISSFWAYLKGFFQGFLEFIYDTLLWFVGVIETVFEYLGDLLSGLWELISETVLSLFDTVLEWIWYIGEWLWELMLSAFDWAVGLGLEFIQWILDKFPQLQLPAGFDEEVNHFIRFGMLLNEVIPVRETFMLFAIYIAILLIMVIFRAIKTLISFIPFV